MAAYYKCDACGKVIADRYQAKMKEFYISYFADDGMLIPWNHTRKVKVDLCDDCYHGLNEIARRKSNESL